MPTCAFAGVGAESQAGKSPQVRLAVSEWNAPENASPRVSRFNQKPITANVDARFSPARPKQPTIRNSTARTTVQAPIPRAPSEARGFCDTITDPRFFASCPTKPPTHTPRPAPPQPRRLSQSAPLHVDPPCARIRSIKTTPLHAKPVLVRLRQGACPLPVAAVLCSLRPLRDIASHDCTRRNSSSAPAPPAAPLSRAVLTHVTRQRRVGNPSEPPPLPSLLPCISGGKAPPDWHEVSGLWPSDAPAHLYAGGNFHPSCI